uniref:Helicase C-terminal domain-containing protein n=1 Tax=Coccidioides posadasii RMSCC 3488 TaxID=454284 RepID=A0A0J6EZ13_COCPO|nr:hypothetical protein CPAG_02154 [Coccidioides posadasii RMSCC 3488]
MGKNSTSMMEQQPDPSHIELEPETEASTLEEALMLPEVRNTEQGVALQLNNDAEANTAIYDNHGIQETIAQTHSQPQGRMSAMGKASSTVEATGDAAAGTEQLISTTEHDSLNFTFDDEYYDDLSERNEALLEKVQFQKAQNEELKRLKRLKSQKEKREEEPSYAPSDAGPRLGSVSASELSFGNTKYQLFCSDDDKGTATKSTAGRAKSEAKQRGKGKQTTARNKIDAKVKRQTAASGFEAFRQSLVKRKTSGKGVHKGKSSRQNKHGKQQPKKSRQNRKREAVDMNLHGLFSSGIVKAAKANAAKPGIPSFSAKAKDKAMKELIANIPQADPKVVSTDRNAIMSAIIKFTRKPKADGNGSWLHPDMKTSLFHYQLLGVAFMRDRENSPVAPFGGFLCDEMGFGKTIQAIANMVDGRPGPDDNAKTTLIVVPPHLVNHCVTTYSEVRKSYPELEFPRNKTKESGNQATWQAHEIKNHASKTSLAVRMLSGRFRWIVTGTPVHNNVLEFFPYFEFLKIPQTGNFERFCKNYCPNGQVNHARLSNLLRGYMLRRTHEQTLFGLPVLKLPDIDESTITVQFSRVEKFLYREIIKFMMSSYILGDDDQFCLSQTHNGKWPLLLKLRMFTSHLLLSQKVLQDILTDNLMKELRSYVGGDVQADDLKIIHLFDNLLSEKPLPTLADVLGAKNAVANPRTLSQEDILNRYRTLLNSADCSADVKKCARCKSSPYIAYIASCMHIYCHACITIVWRDRNRVKCSCSLEVHEFTFCDAIPALYHSIMEGEDPCDDQSSTNKAGSKEKPEEMGSKNWTSLAGHLMPSAKLTSVRSCVAAWLANDPETKVTIFTQFLGMVEILSSMCVVEGWGHTTLTGNVPPSERHRDIEEFRTDPSIRVLISSLKAGGTGLSLTMAEKCILIDLWWNEAMEQQAFCRLFRYGQKKEVEIVRITVKNSIDDRIQLIQNAKSSNIEKTMGLDALAFRDSLEDILKIFGVVEDDDAEDGFAFISDDEA